MVMYSVAVSAMVVILADRTGADGTFPGIGLAARRRLAVGRGPNVAWRAAHRPFMPKPNIGTRNPTASDDPGLPSGPSRRANVVTAAMASWAASRPFIASRTARGRRRPGEQEELTSP